MLDEQCILEGKVLDGSVDGSLGSETYRQIAVEADLLETRSLLYRAITRAHMLFVIVNEQQPGGFLERLAENPKMGKNETGWKRFHRIRECTRTDNEERLQNGINGRITRLNLYGNSTFVYCILLATKSVF